MNENDARRWATVLINRYGSRLNWEMDEQEVADVIMEDIERMALIEPEAELLISQIQKQMKQRAATPRDSWPKQRKTQMYA